MTSKTKPTVSAAIDADNDITSPLDFSYKCLAGIQGLFWYSIRYQLHFSLFRKALIFLSSYFSLFIDAMEEEPRAGPHKFIRVEVICRSSQLLQSLRRIPFSHRRGGGGGRILQIAERQMTSKFRLVLHVCPRGETTGQGGVGISNILNFGVEIPHTRAKVPHCGLKFPRVHREFEWHQSRDQPQPEKTADILQRHYWFPRKMMTDK